MCIASNWETKNSCIIRILIMLVYTNQEFISIETITSQNQ